MSRWKAVTIAILTGFLLAWLVALVVTGVLWGVHQ